MKYNPEEDGITHINIYSKGKTELGRWLSNFQECEIECCLGKFKSIEGLIFYMGSFKEEMRYLYGYQAKKIGNELDRGIRMPDYVFMDIIRKAIEYKIKSNKQMETALMESELPLTHYYNYDGKVVKIPKWNWLKNHIDKIRDKLKKSPQYTNKQALKAIEQTKAINAKLKELGLAGDFEKAYKEYTDKKVTI